MNESTRLKAERSALDVDRSASTAVDAANPWPGLDSFTEDARAFFHGRDGEIAELCRRVQRKLLTVLFGQSGLGKTSILRAGVVPRLRGERYCPVYVRIDYGDTAPAPAEQIKHALAQAMGLTDLASPATESLWEFLHRRDEALRDAAGRPLVPLLIFDQFEEIFTLGQAGEGARARAAGFAEDLADLVENRAPHAVEEKLERDENAFARIDFSRADYRVLISLREDYLPHLESLKGRMPSVTQNRVRLAPMTGVQALEAVVKPGGALVTPEVARAIVEFVAGARGGSVERLAELQVEPPLLSVICRELNERRRALGQPQITADLVTGNRREILTDFYERSVADLPEAMRTFVEDKLLTKSGFRDNLALETALEEPGVTRELIDALVSRRLLRIEDRIGTQRVELTHDVLADVVRASRDARQQRLLLEQAQERERQALAGSARRARRQRFVIASLGTTVVGLLIGAFFGIRAQRRAERVAREKAAESSRTDFIFGSRLLEENKTPEGLAYLVRAARSDPTNHIVGSRLVSALSYRGFAEPKGKALLHSESVAWVKYAPDGRRALTYSNRHLRYWDLGGGSLLRNIPVPGYGEVSPDFTRVAISGDGGALSVVDLQSGQTLMGPVRHEPRIVDLAFSPDNRWLVSTSSSYVARLWDAATGELKATMNYPPYEDPTHFGSMAISPDGNRLVLARRGLQIWRLPDGTPLTEVVIGGSSSAAFSPDGKLIVLTDSDRQLVPGAHFYDAWTGTSIGEPMPHGGYSINARFSHNGKILATTSSDGALRLWDVPSGKSLGPPLQHGSDVGLSDFTPDDRNVVTRSGDGVARIWNIERRRLALEPIRTGDIMAVALHPDGSELLTASRDGAVRRWGLASGEVTPMEIAADPARLRLVRSAAGAPFAWSIYRDHMQRIDLLTGRPTDRRIVFPADINTPLLAPDERWLSVRTANDALELWHLEGDEIRRKPLGRFRAAGSLARFSPDSRYFAMSLGEVLHVWETQTGKLIVGPTSSAMVAASRTLEPFSASGRRLASASREKNIARLVDLDTGGFGPPIRHTGALWSMGFSPDERVVATASGYTVELWDAATSQRIGDPLPHRSVTRGATFSRDGRQLLTWTRLETNLWDVSSHALLHVMAGGNDVHPAVFNRDESRIATLANTRGEIRLFDTGSGSLVAEPIAGAGGTGLQRITFTADGRYIVLGKSDETGGLRVWPTPPQFAGPVPPWLLRLATIVASGEIDPKGVLREHRFVADAFEAIRAELSALPVDAPYVEWGRWILADRTTRPIGPGFTVTAANLRTRHDEPAAGPSARSSP